MPDGLLRRPQGDDKSDPPLLVFDKEAPHIHPFGVWLTGNERLYLGFQEGFWRQLEQYLTTLTQPEGMDSKAYRALRRKAANFFVQTGRLLKRGSLLPRIVVTIPEKQDKILRKLHKDLGHHGVVETYRTRGAQQRFDTQLGRRKFLDVVHIKASGTKYLIVAQDDFSGWVEAKFLNNIMSEAVEAFLQEHWTMRYGLARSYSTDGESEFGGALASMLQALLGQHRVSTPYYPKAQGMVERGNAPLKAALVKLAGELGKNCKNFLPLVLFANRISTKRTTGYTPYKLVFSQRAALPIDLDIKSFLGVEWEEVQTTSDLLAACSRQLERSEDARLLAFDRMMIHREQAVWYWEDWNATKIRESLAPGNLVLAYNRSLEMQWGQLFAHKWNGPFRVVKQVMGGSYVLAELNGTKLKHQFAADQVKRYFLRGGVLDQK
ncbi:hypothetical protein PCANC_25509 [Puccinia coronata f. sp. avenae]|uniref:Integrase catalytic domain-containing protein n=1 Tax=Puccinia coronata f. sp. avenae TaxID=200324 RepID=A0A2N5U9B1_9BASI|nr:hypothetical protein PCANC_25509 [Puccinia coronata f. sp. avenae]